MKIVVKKSLCDAYCAEKGIKDTSKLVKKQITNKNGKRTTVWVRPEEARGFKQGYPQAQNSNAGKDGVGTRTVGDTILFVGQDGRQHNGLVMAVGKDGVTVTDERGNKDVHVPHGNVKRVLSKVNEKDEIRNLYDARRLAPTFRDGTDGLQPESCDTLDGMWNAAKEAMSDFAKYSESVMEKFKDINPILLKRKTLKGQERAKEKLRADEAAYKKGCEKIGLKYEPQCYDENTDTYHCRTLRDVDGHTFCCKNIEDVSKMLNYFVGDRKNIIRIKNNFANPSSVGYSDINMNIRLPNGTIAEIQLNTTANMVAKENYGHALYEVWRSVNANPKYRNLSDSMGEAQKKLYGLSNELSKSGNFPSEITNPFGATYKPYGEAIRMEVRKALPGIQLAYNAGDIDQKTYDHFQNLLKKLDLTEFRN